MEKLKNNLKAYAPIYTGVIVRIIFFTVFFIIGYHSDESLELANAKLISTSGVDVYGQSFPIYFNNWLIGGQSPLPTYSYAILCKFFGPNLFVFRFLHLLLSCLALIFFYKLAELLFNKKSQTTLTWVYALAIGSVFDSFVALDCLFFEYFLVFGLYAFFYGIKKQKYGYLLVSSFFFAHGFYCYIASVFVVPSLLIALYLYQIIKNKLKIRYAIINAFIVTIISIPFIIFGLVSLNIIEPFTFWKFTFPDMSGYVRGTEVNFNILNILINITSVLQVFDASFQTITYPLLALPIIGFLFYRSLNKVKLKENVNYEILVPVAIGILPLLIFTQINSEAHRWSSIFVLLILLFAPVFLNITNSINKKSILIILMCTTLLLNIPMRFINNTHNNNYSTYNNISLSQDINNIEVYYEESDDGKCGVYFCTIGLISASEYFNFEYGNLKEIQKRIYNGERKFKINDNLSVCTSKELLDKDALIILSHSKAPNGFKRVASYKFFNVFIWDNSQF